MVSMLGGDAFHACRLGLGVGDWGTGTLCELGGAFHACRLGLEAGDWGTGTLSGTVEYCKALPRRAGLLKDSMA